MTNQLRPQLRGDYGRRVGDPICPLLQKE